MASWLYQAQIALLSKIGAAYGNMYTSALQIYTSFPALQNVTRLLNGPTDLLHRKMLSNRRRDVAQKLKSQIRQTHHVEIAEDELRFCAGNIKLKFHSCFCVSREVKLEGVLEQPQGSMGVLFGPHSRGKTTLCNVIGGFHLLDPDAPRTRGADHEPCFFTPGHLRVVNVSGPLFFHGTLLENLTFGVNLETKDGESKRVEAICEEVGGLEGIVKHLNSRAVHNWASIFSGTECLLLAMARALIVNPNLLCIHKIIDMLNNESAMRVLKALRKFINERGLVQGGYSWEVVGRRPRTVFMTANELKDIVRQQADYAYRIDRRIELVHPTEPMGEVEELS